LISVILDVAAQCLHAGKRRGALETRLMIRGLARLRPGLLSTRNRGLAVYALLLAANFGAWAWAFSAFHAYPILLGTAALAYSFGLRHAFDADHIAAIDNVTRKLMQQGQRPVGVGLYFSLGHSTIVVGLTIAIALTATALQDRFAAFKTFGAVAGTLVSALFLFAIAAANVTVLVSVWRSFSAVRRGERFVEEDLDLALAGRGLMARLFRGLFRVVRQSWQMYPIGLLFGLGFDTATEVGLLGVSATQAAQGLSIWSILVFPALFTAGMTLLDTTDSVVMLGAYGWAFAKPIRKLYYNLTITAASVAVAVIVGGLETLNLIGGHFGLTERAGFWGAVGALNDNFGTLGYVVVGVFIFAWLVSAIIYRLKRYDEIETVAP
jgi:nickel/cobalt transporter (NiCoT) family protein